MSVRDIPQHPNSRWAASPSSCARRVSSGEIRAGTISSEAPATYLASKSNHSLLGTISTTGRASIEAVRAQAGAMRAIAERLKASPEDAVEKLDRFMAASRETERELAQLRMESLASKAADMAGRAEEINGARVLVDSIDGLDAEGLRNLGDMLRDRLGTAAVIVGSRVDGRLSFIALVAPELVARGLHAGQLVKEAARLTGGGGGGRPEMAQAGGKDVEKLGEALAQVREAIRSKLASQLH